MHKFGGWNLRGPFFAAGIAVCAVLSAACSEGAQISADDVCLPNPCQNAGLCTSEDGVAVCICAAGFSGARCTEQFSVGDDAALVREDSGSLHLDAGMADTRSQDVAISDSAPVDLAIPDASLADNAQVDAFVADNAQVISDAGGQNDLASDPDVPAPDAQVDDAGVSDRGLVDSQAGDASLGNTVRGIFLHHSTGGVVWNGGVADWFTTYNDQNQTNYSLTEYAYPHGPYPWDNYPYDYWHIWVENAGETAFDGQETLEILTAEYDFIVFKHCYPASDVLADIPDPDISSSRKSLENYKLQYFALRDKLHSFPDTVFILWTGAARVEASTNPDNAARARDFFHWVKNTWDTPGDNIFIWDFQQLETEGGLYLLPNYASSTSNSHPNSSFAAQVAPLFGQRVVDVIQGLGDQRSITGEVQ